MKSVLPGSSLIFITLTCTIVGKRSASRDVFLLSLAATSADGKNTGLS